MQVVVAQPAKCANDISSNAQAREVRWKHEKGRSCVAADAGIPASSHNLSTVEG